MRSLLRRVTTTARDGGVTRMIETHPRSSQRQQFGSRRTLRVEITMAKATMRDVAALAIGEFSVTCSARGLARPMILGAAGAHAARAMT